LLIVYHMPVVRHGVNRNGGADLRLVRTMSFLLCALHLPRSFP